MSGNIDYPNGIDLRANKMDDRELSNLLEDLNLYRIEPNELIQQFDALYHFLEKREKRLIEGFFYYTACKIYEACKNRELVKKFYDKYIDGIEGSYLTSEVGDTFIEKLIRNKIENNRQFSCKCLPNVLNQLVFFITTEGMYFFLSILNSKFQIKQVSYEQIQTNPDIIDTPLTSINKASDRSNDTNIFDLNDNDLTRLYSDVKPDFHILGNVTYKSDSGGDRCYSNIEMFKDYARACAIINKDTLPSIKYYTFGLPYRCFDISPDGVKIACAQQGVTMLFNIDCVPFTGQSEHSRDYVEIPSLYVYDLKFTLDSRTLAICCYERVIIFDVLQCVILRSLRVTKNINWAIDSSPILRDDFIVASDSSYVYNIVEGNIVSLQVDKSSIVDIKYHPNGRLAAFCTQDKTISIISLYREGDKASEKRKFINPEFPSRLLFTRNGLYLLIGNKNGSITSYDIINETILGSFTAHSGHVRDMAISLEGSILATIGKDGDICLWDVSTLCSFSITNTKPLKRYQPRRADSHRLVFTLTNVLTVVGTRHEKDLSRYPVRFL